MLILYKILAFLVYYLTYPLLFCFHMGGSRKWSNRLGFRHADEFDINYRCDVWLHAASMGEVMVLKILAEQLKRINRNLSFYVTVVTETGYHRARELFGENHVGFLPLDYTRPVKRFLKRIKPGAAVFIETEIWPVLVLILKKHSIPVFLANGRLSVRSFGRYCRFKGVMQTILRCYRRIMVQTESDRQRFIQLGADAKIVEVTGSLKFDASPPRISDDKLQSIENILPFANDDEVFIAGSIRNDEHQIIAGVYSGLQKALSGIKMILVPRYLDKIDDLLKIVKDKNITYCLYSEIEVGIHETENPDIVIVDKMGILNDLYAVSDIAFVGGTFDNMGGHNILEPVWAGIPVLYGPSIENVRESAEYIVENKFGRMVLSEDDLIAEVVRFFEDKTRYNRKSASLNDAARSTRTAQTILENMP